MVRAEREKGNRKMDMESVRETARR